MTGLTAISSALDIAKKLQNYDKQFNEAEFKLQIAELYTSLSDAKIALSEAKQQIVEKNTEIKQLKDKQSKKMRTVNYRGFNFGVGTDGRSIGRPFCPICEQKQDIQVQITRNLSKGDFCSCCEAIYSSYPWQLPKDYQIPQE